MSNDKRHIDLSRLERYINKEMSSKERNAFEKEALTNPLLADTIEGYENNPGSFGAFKTKHSKKLNDGRGLTFITGLTILGLLFVTAYLINFENPKTNKSLIKEKSIHKDLYVAHITAIEDIEEIPASIDTLPFIDPSEIIQIKELKEKQNEGKAKVEDQGDTEVEEHIQIEETFDVHEDYHYVSEEKYRLGQNSLETVYMLDLMVVDYRVIKRDNKKIHYKRMELSGLSASEENENENHEQFTFTEVEVPYVNYLRQSMIYFADGKYKKALVRYQTILEQYNDDINAHFYGGLCLYNLGQYEEAINYFDQLIYDEYNVFDQESSWYKAKALIQLKRINEAKSILKTIIAQGGFYSKQAIELNKSL